MAVLRGQSILIKSILQVKVISIIVEGQDYHICVDLTALIYVCVFFPRADNHILALVVLVWYIPIFKFSEKKKVK